MNTSELITALSAMPGRNVNLTNEQEAVIRHPNGPSWVLAGPGTGKTEILTVLLLRLIYVDNDPVQIERIPPESIFITTFTKKAARNLEDRLSIYRNHIINQYPELATIDISKLRIGTLHGMCNDLLQEYRYPVYQNVRLMDDFEQCMFVYENSSLIRQNNANSDLPLWKNYEYLFPQHIWRSKKYPPNKWARAKALVSFFNRIVEDRISVSDLNSSGGYSSPIALAYKEYLQLLEENYRCDFSHIQLIFLNFLQSPIGQMFLKGEKNSDYKGIRWVLVDEYQDTNLIQEEIYMRLANLSPHNIVVVGDDDQAMYRFRGGSVECMVTFDSACNYFLNIPQTNIQKYPLSNNFRSHSDIVSFCNDYVTSFPVMKLPGARVSGKPVLTAARSIAETYPAVSTLSGKTIAKTAELFAQTVNGLISNGIVSDPNQCCLLLKSTKESPQNAGPYADALRIHGLTPYNPRNKSYLEQEEIQTLMGALLSILDQDSFFVPQQPKDIPEIIMQWRVSFDKQVKLNPELAAYVSESVKRIKNTEPGKYLAANLGEIVYYLLGLQPFSQWLDDPVCRMRLGRVTGLIESYSSMPVQGYPSISRGNLKISPSVKGQIVDGWLRNFYHLFIGYMAQTGLDDIESEEVICPSGMVPIMTIHQSKGLEFPFVFVGHCNSKAQISSAHHLEDELGRYPIHQARSFTRPSATDRADLDLIRQYYVAYSRAEYALIILGTDSQLKQGAIPCGPDRTWLRQKSIPL